MKIGDLEVQEVKVLRLQPDDILVFKAGILLSSLEFKQLQDSIADFLKGLGLANKVLVLQRDFDIEVIREDDEELHFPPLFLGTQKGFKE